MSRRPATDESRRPVAIELVLLRVDAGTPHYRTARVPLPAGCTPDEAALHAATAACGVRPAICHSTSWRFEQADTLVLTYAALPDADVGSASEPLTAPAVVSSGDPLRPAPEQLHGHHVAAHAVRHLALLAREDPTVATVAAADPVTWAALGAAADRTPTGTHASVHRAAGEHVSAHTDERAAPLATAAYR